MKNRIDPFWNEEEDGKNKPNKPFGISPEQAKKTSARLHYAFGKMLEAVKEDVGDDVNARGALCVFLLMKLKNSGMSVDAIKAHLQRIDEHDR